MKRIIITVLTAIVGLFGYTVVDTAIETRVSSLENRVSYLESVVEDYHGILNEVITTTRKAVLTTEKPTESRVVLTTKKPAATQAANNNNNAETTKNSNNEDKLVDDVIDPDGGQFAGYRYDAEGDFYYTDDKECWQKGAGYNEVYDNMAPMTGMFIDQIRIRFSYENKDWMLQFWKGQYGFLLVGGEVGIYTAPLGTYENDNGAINHYDCADKEDWLNMQLDCYWSENNNGTYKKVFTREYGKYWWATGFVKGQLTKYTIPKTELKLKVRITFKSNEMANLFIDGLRDSGFVRTVGSDQLVDDSYYQNGADVWMLWSTIYHDCFVDEGGDSVVVTTAPVTQAPEATSDVGNTGTTAPREEILGGFADSTTDIFYDEVPVVTHAPYYTAIDES